MCGAAALIVAAIAACPVRLEGDPRDVAAIQQRGAPACTEGGKIVRVERRGRSWRLVPEGERERIVESSTVAAMLIESWSQPPLFVQAPPNSAGAREVSGDLSTAREQLPPNPRARREPGDASDDLSDAQARPLPSNPPNNVRPLGGRGLDLDLDLSVAAELGIDSTAARWLGGLVRARFDFAPPITPSLALRAAHGSPGGDLDPTGASRIAIDLLAAVELPLFSGAFAPGIAAGGGWMHSTRASCEARCPIVGDDYAISTIGLRLETWATSTLHLSPTWSLELTAALTLSPLAHRAAFLPGYAAGAAQLTESERAQLTLAGEPLWVARLAAGFRWEEP